MKTLPVILLITGVLTISIGAMCFRESKSKTDDFNNAINKINTGRVGPVGPVGPFIDATSKLSKYYNDKCNALSLYGLLAIAYGIIVTVIAIYMLVPDRSKKNFMMFVGVAIVAGIALIIAAMTIKDLHHPNPVKPPAKK
jgi:hypothetical protein